MEKLASEFNVSANLNFIWKSAYFYKMGFQDCIESTEQFEETWYLYLI